MKFVKVLPVAFVALALSSSLQAATARAACTDMMNKLGVMYNLRNFPKGFDSSPIKFPNRVEAVEFMIVSSAYGTTKDALDKQWPGFWNFSVQTVLFGLDAQLNIKDFRNYSLESCLTRYEQ